TDTGLTAQPILLHTAADVSRTTPLPPPPRLNLRPPLLLPSRVRGKNGNHGKRFLGKRRKRLRLPRCL
ncbi:hypothetical protein CRENBAI_010560, partial [Crenichthys baileyi]